MNRRDHKFQFVKHVIDQQRLGVLVLQETHLDSAGAATFDTIYQKWFKLIYSPDPTDPTLVAGVTFLLNKKFIDVDHILVFNLVPGRALMITIPWHKHRMLTILNIYAPNKPKQRDELWSKLWTEWKNNSRLPLPDIILGDWNFVEDGRDRLSGDRGQIPPSFTRLKSLFQMEDGWRNTFQDECQYTCRRNGPHRDHDRCLPTSTYSTLFDSCRGWRIENTAVRTDHSLVATQIVCRPDKKLGKGRQPLPLYLLKTGKFTNKVKRLIHILKSDFAKLKTLPRLADHNVQTVWAKFKRDCTEHSIHCSRLIEKDESRQIRTWKAQLYLIIHDEDVPQDDRYLATYLLEKKIKETLTECAQKK
ncbi:hypothetical protein C8R45DRAFT_823986 [Mycena sanguinolenta]|nr:hypothetical protein C8R45DRAFT_823986 [Mycena sanguinolenta]